VPVIFDHVPVTRNAGSHLEGPASVPDSAVEGILRLARRTTAEPTLWAPGVTVSFQSEIDFNNAGTWAHQAGGFTGVGGIHIAHGVELVESFVRFPLPPGTNRRIRLPLTVAGGTLVTEVTVETVP
jgi:hypothetical protein